MSKDRVRVLVGVALTLAIVLPLGWIWWDSRLPASYSVMDMGTPDWGDGRGPSSAMGHDHEHHGSSSVSVDDLDTDAARKADVVVDLTAREGTVTLASGQKVSGYTLNRTSPGPTITATVGQLVEVRLQNESVQGGVSLHWHGVDVPNAEDGVAGVTQNAVMPGTQHTYRWVAPHVGTYWYHSHQLSHEQVVGGLFGGLVILPERPEPGVADTLVLAHQYSSKPTLNGSTKDLTVWARPGQPVRVRLINTDNGPQTAWADVPYRVRAVDGYDVNRPTAVTDRSIGIPAGGKIDLELTAPADGSDARVELLGGVGIAIGPPGGGSTRPVSKPKDKLDLLSYGSPAAVPFDERRPDRRFTYSIGRRPGFVKGRPGMWWSVNGKLFPDLPMAMVKEGEVVRMTISNHSNEVHPMHLHGHHAVVLQRNGTKASGSPWWYDSLDVRPGEKFVVSFVADNPGIWMDHCHNLKHAADGMVSHLMYEGVSTPYKLGSASGNEPE